MSNEDLYYDLPYDPELAFLLLEERFRKELHEVRESNAMLRAYLQYINQTHAAARALNVPVLSQFDISSAQLNNSQTIYAPFFTQVENYIMQVKIRTGRRVQGVTAHPRAG